MFAFRLLLQTYSEAEAERYCLKTNSCLVVGGFTTRPKSMLMRTLIVSCYISIHCWYKLYALKVKGYKLCGYP